MPHLLVINPNTTSSITELLHRHCAQALVQQDVLVQATTARFGAPYIVDEASYAVAGHACLDAWAAWLAQTATPPAAVLVGCFGDPGLWALRESAPMPVTGLAEAAFAAAAARHGRFAVVTGGAGWKPMLERLAAALGHGSALAAVHTVAPSGAQLAADPQGARALLTQACRDALRQSGANAVVLGGAGLAGMAAMIEPEVGAPVIDSVLAGARHAAALLGQPGMRRAAGFSTPWNGLSPEMEALGPG
ncbi:MAG TPA: aspartate/glutamate racemase family protein [Burkholderiaceae bacterium]